MKELVAKINAEYEVFAANAAAQVEKGDVYKRQMFMWMWRTRSSWFSYTAITVSNSASMPLPLRASTGTIGTPSIRPRLS